MLQHSLAPSLYAWDIHACEVRYSQRDGRHSSVLGQDYERCLEYSTGELPHRATGMEEVRHGVDHV